MSDTEVQEAEQQAGADPTIRRARRGDLRALAGVLADAFSEEPLHRWVMGPEEPRRERSVKFFRLLLKAAWREGHVVAADDASGVAVWYGPDAPYGGTRTRYVLPFGLRRLLGRRLSLVRRESARLGLRRPGEPHWYLAYLGTDPEVQGKGIGRALLREGLERADERGHPVWLDTCTERTRGFYEGFGFEAVDETEVQEGPVVWGMLRSAHVGG